MAFDAMGDLAPDSPEFLRQMQHLIPQIWLYPFRLLDGGHIVLRAQFTLNLSPLVKGVGQCAEVASRLSQLVTTKLYNDPDREKHRLAVVDAMHRLGNQHRVADELRIPQAVVSKSVRLQQQMDERGTTDAYGLVTAPPADYNRVRLYRHKRYRFSPDTNCPSAPPFTQ